MTKSEAKQLVTEPVVFPIASSAERRATVTVEETEIAVDKSSVKSDVKIRFARLKKSLRKRSASIL